jgi:Ti-type conjugative transfer relaxase TraA
MTPSRLGSSGRGPGYYLSLTASSYYLDAPEPQGIWYGLGAEEFGLKGDVAPDDLIAMCEGYDPRDRTRHVRNAGKDTRYSGDDLCFGAPKSVSVAWALADQEMRDQIEGKALKAVKDALDYVQAACGYARVGAGGQELKSVPLTFAIFSHSSSRLGDPHLHFHSLCPNLTLHETSYGKLSVTAIDSTLFYDIQKAAGALFRASLAAGMRELGFQVEQDRWSFRLKGFSDEVCERFSQRRAEIVDGILKAAKLTKKLSELDAREVLISARGLMAELVCLKTRRGKEEYTRDEMFPVWQDIAGAMGIPTGYVQGLRQGQQTLTPREKRATKEKIFGDTLKAMNEEFSHFSKTDLMQKLAEASQAKGLTARDVRELVESKIAAKEVLLLPNEALVKSRNRNANSFREKTEARYATEEMLKLEGLLLSAVERMKEKSATIGTRIAEKAIEVANRHRVSKGEKELNAEQANAVRVLTAGPGLIASMTGKAGTGKSTTLNTCRLAWEAAGNTVIGTAIQGKTADELSATSGIKESRTMDSLLFRLEKGWTQLTRNHVVVLDEAGMVPTKKMAQLVREVEAAGAKLILCGDAKQLQPISAGGPFRSITHRLAEAMTCALTKIVRQREEWRREAVHHFSQGEAKEALLSYLVHGQLHVVKAREDAVNGLVERWKADNGIHDPKNVLLLCSLNAEVSAVNRLCQEARQEAGQLGETKMFVNGNFIHRGDKILLGKNDKKLDVKNGFTAEVTKVDTVNGWLTVRLDKDDREVTLSVANYGTKNIRLGYAMTVHKSQGVTVDHCHVLLGGHMSDLHLAYVQASRSRETTHLFIDEAHAGPGLRDVVRSLSRDRSKDLARDLIDRTYDQVAQAEEQIRSVAHRISLGR